MRRRKLLAEINVVPYIDVMLVLLIIFMVTAPLLMAGVQLELPRAAANIVEYKPEAPEPFVLSVAADGTLYIDDMVKTKAQVATAAAALYRQKPATEFLLRGDRRAVYDDVLQAMVLLKDAGVENVRLITEVPVVDSP